MWKVRNSIVKHGGGEHYWGGEVNHILVLILFLKPDAKALILRFMLHYAQLQREVDSYLSAFNQMRVSCSLLANTLNLWIEMSNTAGSGQAKNTTSVI